MFFDPRYLYFDWILYSFFGWIAQGLYVGFKKHKFLNTGFFYGPYVPIYGFGALIVIICEHFIPQNFLNPVSIFFGAMILTSILEYFTSWLMQEIFHQRWWNYSKRPFNLNGRICLLNSVLYGIAGVFITYVSQPIVIELEKILSVQFINIFEICFSLVFATDAFFTFRHMFEEKKVIENIHAHIQALEKAFEKSHHVKVDEAKEQYEAWLKDKPELKAHLDAIHENVEKLHQRADSHLAKAFPEKKLQEAFEHSRKEAEKIHARIEKRLSEYNKTQTSN